MNEFEDLYSTLLTASRTAFGNQLYTVAYHALAAAMNCAVFLKDSAKLLEIETLARKHHEQLSSDLADRPSSVEFDLYLSLMQMAKTYLLLSHRTR